MDRRRRSSQRKKSCRDQTSNSICRQSESEINTPTSHPDDGIQEVHLEWL
ncbi:MAG: hypothetical protein LW870_04690 [Pirellula sp.]|nr:hypothetical protein [Pirellula sp.]